MIIEAYASLSSAADHAAAGWFDSQEFVDAACTHMPRDPVSDDELTWIQIHNDDGELAAVSMHQWAGESSAVVLVSGPFPWLKATFEALRPLVYARHLMLYDAQTQSVYNNQRTYPGN